MATSYLQSNSSRNYLRSKYYSTFNAPIRCELNIIKFHVSAFIFILRNDILSKHRLYKLLFLIWTRLVSIYRCANYSKQKYFRNLYLLEKSIDIIIPSKIKYNLLNKTVCIVYHFVTFTSLHQ